MTEHRLLEELRLADPAPIDAARPEGVWSSDVVLQVIEQRRGTMQLTQPRTQTITPTAKPPRRRLVAALAAGRPSLR